LPLAELDGSLNLPGIGPIGPLLQRVADQQIERIEAD